MLGRYGSMPPREAHARAQAAATRALEIDDDIAEAHTSLAYSRTFYFWDWPGARKSFERALELNPSYATARHWYGLSLTVQGLSDEGVAEMKRAQELDPLSPIINSNLARVLYYGRRYDEAFEQARKTIELEPRFAYGHVWLAEVHRVRRQLDEAIALLRKGASLSDATDILGLLGFAYGSAGRRAEAQTVLATLVERSSCQYVASYDIAMVHLALGQEEQFFAALEKAVEERDTLVVYMNVDPALDGVRRDPRFQRLARRLGLPSAASQRD